VHCPGKFGGLQLFRETITITIYCQIRTSKPSRGSFPCVVGFSVKIASAGPLQPKSDAVYRGGSTPVAPVISPCRFAALLLEERQERGLGLDRNHTVLSSHTLPKMRPRNWGLASGSVSVDQKTAKSSCTLPVGRDSRSARARARPYRRGLDPKTIFRRVWEFVH